MVYRQGSSTTTYFRKNNGKYEDVGDQSSMKGLLDYLVQKTELVGHQLSFEEAKADPEMISPNEFAFYFGSFSEAAKLAWDKVRWINRQKIKNEREEDFDKNLLKRGYEKMNEKTGRGGKRPRYSIAELKFKLRWYYKQHGKMPTQADVGLEKDLPSYVTLVKYLGPRNGWDKIVQENGSDESEAASGEETNELDVSSQTSEVDTQASETEEESLESVLVAGVDNEGQSQLIGYNSMVEYDAENETDEGKVLCSESKDVSGEENLKVETVKNDSDGAVKIEMKISVPDREKPIFITLSV